MKRTHVMAAVLLAAAFNARAQDEAAALAQRLAAVEANAELGAFAALEKLQARQAVDALANARGRERATALYLAQRRVEIAEVAARSQAAQREVDRLDRERSELLVEASRRDAERARAEAEHLRVQAQIQAEEAERLRQQAAADAVAMQDVEAALQGVAGAQAAKLNAAREREAKLAREEAELMAGGKLPPAKRDARGEVFTLNGDAFVSGKATLIPSAAASVRTLAAYLKAGPATAVRIEGVAAQATLAQQRVEAVRDALIEAGATRSQVRAAVGAEGRSKAKVEIVVSSK